MTIFLIVSFDHSGMEDGLPIPPKREKRWSMGFFHQEENERKSMKREPNEETNVKKSDIHGDHELR